MSKTMRRAFGGLALTLAASLFVPSGAVWAAPPSGGPDDAVAAANRLDPMERQTRREARFDGERVKAGDVVVEVQADTRLVRSAGTAVLAGDEVDFVVRGTDDGAQILAVAQDRDGLVQRYSFAGKYLELVKDGAVVVRDGDMYGEPVALIEPAWAKDATGRRLASRFSIDGDTLIQTTTESASTRYPVVADPRIRSAWYGWSVDFTKYETSRISRSTAICVAVTGIIAVGGGIIAAALGAACGALTVFADIAVENGKCVSVKIFHGGYAGVPWMTKCYA